MTPLHPRDTAAHSFALAIILACQLMLVLDGTVVYSALPHILTDLHFSPTGLSWVQNAYLLTFGGFMLLGARTGDILGYRRVFIGAVAAFTAASFAGGLAPSASWLLVARALQGLAAAFAAPAALALLMITFPQGPARLRALGFYTAVSGSGSATGLVLGGILIDLMSWRSVLFINLPIGITLLMVGPWYLPRSARNGGDLDIPGALTATLGMSLLVYGLVGFASNGLSHVMVITCLIAAVLLMAAFVGIERRARQPIMPLSLFDSAERTGAYAVKMLLIGGMLGTFFFLTQYVQNGLGYSALEAGLAFVPLSISQFLMVAVGVPRLMPRMGGRCLLMAGLSFALMGMVCLGQVDVDTRFFPQLALPIVSLGLGTGAALVPLAAAGLTGVAEHNAGAASGLINVTHYLGGALGTAVIVAIIAFSDISNKADAAMITHAFAAAHALSISAIASAVFFTLALLISLVTMRRRPLLNAIVVE